jgi:hypothetical protein
VVIDPREAREVSFRSLAAPGLDEDDLFAALHGLPAGAVWGQGRPASFGPPEPAWDPEAERRRRHRALLRKWQAPGSAGESGG